MSGRKQIGVVVHRARDTAATAKVPGMSIHTGDPMPEVGWDERDTLLAMFRGDALKLFDALKASLPGGTFDQLTCLMLKAKVSLLVVPEK